MKHGANVNAQNREFETPLMSAAKEAGTHGVAEVVNSLLRVDSDETIVGMFRNKAVDVVGMSIEEDNRLAEDIDRVRELLANAPADRAWRRRGYLVLCRAHPDRVQRSQ